MDKADNGKRPTSTVALEVTPPSSSDVPVLTFQWGRSSSEVPVPTFQSSMRMRIQTARVLRSLRTAPIHAHLTTPTIKTRYCTGHLWLLEFPQPSSKPTCWLPSRSYRWSVQSTSTAWYVLHYDCAWRCNSTCSMILLQCHVKRMLSLICLS